MSGRGGNDPGGYQIGVDVEDGAQIRGFGGLGGVVQVTGTGGASTGIVNRGVTIYGAGSTIAGTGDSMTISGTAGAEGSGFGIGVSLLYGGQITGYNNVTPSVVGAGGGASGDSNQGVEMAGAASPASAITGNGEIDVMASAGPGSSVGLFMSNAAAIGPLPYAHVAADSISVNDTASIRGTNTFYGIAITTISATHINLGGADAPGTLGLTAAEVGQLITPRLTLATGDSGNIGDVTISASITRTSATDVYLFPGSGGVHAPASGTDLNLAGGTLYLNGPGPLAMPITGPNADTGFPQLNVAGGVNLNGVALDLTGTTYAGSLNQTFVIVANDGTDAVTGTFQNLPEGALLTWPGSPLFYAQISYVGGSGNDVVLKLVNASANVTNNADAGPNSLRAALAYAGAHSGADAITFDPSLHGATIALTSPIVISDPAGVTIDGRFLPGITISGNHATRLFEVTNGSNATLLSLNIANGGDTTGNGGGGILNDSGATLTVNNCTFTGNATTFRGGAIRNNTGTLTVNQSTFVGNSSTDNGGAIASGGPATINQCTVSQNTATAPPNGGGGIFIGANTLTLRNSIVAGNTAPAGKPADLYNGAGFTRQGANIIESAFTGASSGPAAINADPLLAPLDNYDGPTLTMALEPGSPARDAAVGSTITIDQRFYPVIGTPDIGAYEAGTLDLNYNAYIWESLPAGTTIAQHATTFDYDGDGMTNFNEFLAQTNPSDPNSYLHVTQTSFGSATFTLFFPSVTGRTYAVEISPDLTSWHTFGNSFQGTGLTITRNISFDPVPSKYFVRVQVGP